MDFKLTVVVLLASLVLGESYYQNSVKREKTRWVDLTYALNNQTVMFPGREIIMGTEFEGSFPDGGWLASRGFCISEHTSTHVDAPFHFQKDGKTLSELPLESMLDVPGVLIDVYNKVHKVENGRITVISNYVVTRKDLVEWESKNGPIPFGSLVLVHTGWGLRWPDAAEYLGVAPEDRDSVQLNPLGDPKKPYKFGIDLNAPNFLNFPGFDSTAAQFLCSERNVNGVGIDTISLDPGNSKDFIAHKIFTKCGIYMIENVANLHLLPARGFTLFAVPFKVDKGTGAPTRVLAKLPLRPSDSEEYH